jgi:hypothetical protein
LRPVRAAVAVRSTPNHPGMVTFSGNGLGQGCEECVQNAVNGGLALS